MHEWKSFTFTAEQCPRKYLIILITTSTPAATNGVVWCTLIDPAGKNGNLPLNRPSSVVSYYSRFSYQQRSNNFTRNPIVWAGIIVNHIGPRKSITRYFSRCRVEKLLQPIQVVVVLQLNYSISPPSFIEYLKRERESDRRTDEERNKPGEETPLSIHGHLQFINLVCSSNRSVYDSLSMSITPPHIATKGPCVRQSLAHSMTPTCIFIRTNVTDKRIMKNSDAKKKKSAAEIFNQNKLSLSPFVKGKTTPEMIRRFFFF